MLKPDPAAAFLNYPLGMTPAPLGTKLPRVWEAPGLGYYALRSGWDPDAFVAQVFTKSARGRLTHLRAADQTLNLSINLDDVYETKGRFWFSKFGHLRLPVAPGQDRTGKEKEVPPASGITGMRAIAFDFSGESGAPCLFAVVDKIEGGHGLKRLWLFQPATWAGTKTDAKLPIAKVVATAPHGFIVRPPKSPAALYGFFPHPAAITVNTTPLTWEFINTIGHSRGKQVTTNINCLSVPGDDHFFFVGVVSAQQPPEVKVTGTGLNAEVTVGNRTVKFDGEKIVLGRR